MRRREVIALIASSVVVFTILAIVELRPRGEGARHMPPTASGQIAVPDRPWDDLFQSYGNTSGNWSGADGAQSLLMPDGSTTWFFGDTYLGAPEADGTRDPLATGLAHNSALRYADGKLSPLFPDPPGMPSSGHPDDFALVKPPARYPPSRYELFNGDQIIDGGKVVKFYQLADHGLHPASFPYKLVGTVAETFTIAAGTEALQSAGDTALGVQDTLDSDPLIWGVAVVVHDGYVYIYGVRPYHGGRSPYPLYLARVRTGGLAAGAPWQYFSARPSCAPGAAAWSADPAAARPLRTGVSAGFSVTDVNGTYVLLTSDNSAVTTSNNAVAYYARCPSGFSARSPRYSIYRPHLPTGFLAYEYRIVPQFSSGRDVLVSYSVNSLRVDSSCLSENNYDASVYRPRFLDVVLPGIGGPAGPIAAPPDRVPPGYRTPQIPPSKEIFHPSSARDTYAQTHCHPGTAPAAPSFTLARSQRDGLSLAWAMRPAGMWMYTLVYCDLTTTRCGTVLRTLAATAHGCGRVRAAARACGYVSLWGPTSMVLRHLIPGDTYILMISAAKWVPRPVSAWSRPVTVTVR